jgi:hypothetical protein
VTVLVSEKLDHEVNGPDTELVEVECPDCDGTGEWEPPEEPDT